MTIYKKKECVCEICGEVFVAVRAKKCLSCRRKIYRQKNKKKRKEYDRKYYLKNKEKIKKRQRIYHQKNKDEIKTKNRNYYNKNKKELLKYQKNWRKENAQKVKQHKINNQIRLSNKEIKPTTKRTIEKIKKEQENKNENENWVMYEDLYDLKTGQKKEKNKNA